MQGRWKTRVSSRMNILSPAMRIRAAAAMQAFAIFSTLPYAVGQVQDVGLIFLRCAPALTLLQASQSDTQYDTVPTLPQ